MMEDSIANQIQLNISSMSIIKVIGVGGGGSNAVNNMFRKGITDVSFVVCNTDYQALSKSPVPVKVALGALGAGGKPEVAEKAAEEHIEDIEKVLDDNTKMVFITAGMGGGTGTGAAPVVAKAAREKGILTVGIVTIPFAFEGKKKIIQALKGVARMSRYVDALLVIHNDKLRTIYPEMKLDEAFATADDVLTQAAKGIAEIITVEGYINVDFADVSTIMRNGGVAVMNTGLASGERRITKAIENALNSPLLNNNDIHDAKKILLNIYSSTTDQVRMSEIDEVHEFMERMGDDIEVIWGASFDETLGENVKITLIATGAGMKVIPNDLSDIEAADDIEDETDDTVNSDKKTNVKWGNSGIDPLERWKNALYSDGNDSGVNQLPVTSFDFDDELLEHMQNEPAINRKNLNN